MDDLDAFVATRLALHAVAEWVLAPARYRVDGHIGLRATGGGFGNDVARVDGTDLVVGDQRRPLTTLADAAAFVGVPPGEDTGTYEPVTTWDADAPLAVDAAAARLLADWFATSTDILERFRIETDGPTAITLWPEHFDLGFSAAEVNYGASAGDGGHPTPYLYVGPWNGIDTAEPFWNEPFGASLDHTEAAGAEAFLRRGRDLTRTAPTRG